MPNTCQAPKSHGYFLYVSITEVLIVAFFLTLTETEMNQCSLWIVGTLALGLALTSNAQFQFGQQPISSSNLGPIPNAGGQRAPTNDRKGFRRNGKQSQLGLNRGQQPQQNPEREPFDLDRDVAPERVAHIMGGAIRASVSHFASDASIVIRITVLTTNAFFDANAPYTPTTVGIYSNLGRR